MSLLSGKVLTIVKANAARLPGEAVHEKKTVPSMASAKPFLSPRPTLGSLADMWLQCTTGSKSAAASVGATSPKGPWSLEVSDPL